MSPDAESEEILEAVISVFPNKVVREFVPTAKGIRLLEKLLRHGRIGLPSTASSSLLSPQFSLLRPPSHPQLDISRMPYIDELEARDFGGFTTLFPRDVASSLKPNDTQRTTLIVAGCYIVAIAILWCVRDLAAL